MKKLIVLFVVFFAFSFVNAQKIGVGAALALPMGSFGDVAGVGFGGGAKFEMPLAPQIVGTASVTYLMFGEKEIAGLAKYSYSIIPIFIGAKYLAGGGLYGSVETGINMVSLKSTTQPLNLGFGMVIPGGETTVSSSEFGFALGAGYEMGALDFYAKFHQYASSTASLTVGAYYRFGI